MEKKQAPKEKAALKHRGRPSLYTVALGEQICARLSKGEPLAQICRDEGMPSLSTISEWKTKHTEFSAGFARARDEGFDEIALSCLNIADDARNDFIEKLDSEGNSIGSKFDAEHVQRSKLRVETRLKLLAKWDPKRYGERLELDGGLTLKKSVSDMSDDELLSIAQRGSKPKP